MCEVLLVFAGHSHTKQLQAGFKLDARLGGGDDRPAGLRACHPDAQELP
jgi:hypothetical protein